MTKSDYRILKALENAGDLPVQSPSVLAKNIGITRQHTSTRLSVLVDRGLVERVDEGYYRITVDGSRKITEP